jgi:hypothetical protein
MIDESTVWMHALHGLGNGPLLLCKLKSVNYYTFFNAL